VPVSGHGPRRGIRLPRQRRGLRQPHALLPPDLAGTGGGLAPADLVAGPETPGRCRGCCRALAGTEAPCASRGPGLLAITARLPAIAVRLLAIAVRRTVATLRFSGIAVRAPPLTAQEMALAVRAVGFALRWLASAGRQAGRTVRWRAGEVTLSALGFPHAQGIANRSSVGTGFFPEDQWQLDLRDIYPGEPVMVRARFLGPQVEPWFDHQRVVAWLDDSKVGAQAKWRAG
jgi:hypothetical protein